MELVEIQDLTEFVRNGISVKQYPDAQGVPITRIETIWNGSIDENKFGYADVLEKDMGKYEKYLLNKGDILMTHINSPKHLGKCAIYKDSPKKLIHGMNLLCIRPKLDVTFPQFIKYYFDSIYFKSHVKSISNQSVNQASFSVGKLKKIKIPLPPLPVQKKIAEILDEADKLRQLNTALIKKYDALTQSLFLDMFGDPVTNPKGWETKSIVDLVKDEKYSLKRGPFGGALKKEIFVEQGYLVYEQYHALNNDFTFQRYFITEEKYNELIAFEVKPKDIIISCSGVYLGKLAIVPPNAKKGIINQALLKVTINEQVMTNDFFVFHFSQPYFKQKYFSSDRGAGIPNFPPMKDFKKFPFITPPRALQNQFAEHVQLIEQQKQQAQEALQKSEELFNSLLQKAFKGELV